MVFKYYFFCPNGSGMGQIDMSSLNRMSLTQSDKAQARENQPMKKVQGNVWNFFEKKSKLLKENIETLSQR